MGARCERAAGAPAGHGAAARRAPGRASLSWKALALTLILMVALPSLLVQPAQGAGTVAVDEKTWVTNGPVYSIARDPASGTVYIGGDFTQVGPYTGRGVALDAASGQVDAAFPKVNGTVNAVASDGAGGWFIGGAFTRVGTIARNNIARIKADRSVDPAWNPNASAAVRTLAVAVSGSTVYVGGDFTSIGGQPRSRIAALGAATGAATSWNPNASGSVRALVVSGGIVYAGGDFITIGAQATQPTRSRIAALDAATGDATTWDPSATNTVNALAVSGNTVYVGGRFSTIGGLSRNKIAALDAATGAAAAAWDPNAAGLTVNTVVVSGTTVYAGGDFTSIGGQLRNRIASLDAVTSSATLWNPDFDGEVSALAISGDTVYAGGNFTSVGGQARSRLAALDASGAATGWDPKANSSVYALAVSAGTVYAGGFLTSVGGQTRNRIAAVDPSTGVATGWNPNADNRVYALAVSGSTVYAGGWFTSIGGQPRNRIAALDAITGSATLWNPDASSYVYALAVSGTTVYAGGYFTTTGGLERNRVAALDASTGVPTSWNPNADNGVFALEVSGSTVYAGGSFGSIGGQARNRIAALDASTGLASSWDPNADNYVNALVVSGSTVYAAGYFTTVGGQTRNRIAALDAGTGLSTSWNPSADNEVSTLAVSGSTVYAGGYFTNIGGQARSRTASLDAGTGLAMPWNPNAGGPPQYTTVLALAVSGSTLYAGGDYIDMGGSGRAYFAALLNQAPTISDIPDQTVAEDAFLAPVTFTVNDQEAGPDALTVSAGSSNPALVPVGNILLGGSGLTRAVTIIPAPNQNGTASITVTVSDGSLTASDSFILTVTPVNDAPTLDPVADQSVNEDAGEQTVNLAGVSPGPNESGQVLTWSVASSNLALVPNPTIVYIAPSAAASLKYTPAANGSGLATITLTVGDGGGTASGGVDSVTRTFRVAVNAVNDAPTLDPLADRAVDQGTGEQSVALAGISSGPSDEAGQALTVTATSSNPGLVPNPTVSYTGPGAAGSLRFTPLANAFGSATITVTVGDDGGTVNGGVDRVTRTFRVLVGQPVDTVLLGPTDEVVITPPITLTTTGSLSVTIAFPAGAVSQPVGVSFTLADTGAVSGGMQAVGSGFVLEARNQGGSLVTSFARAFTISVRYNNADIAGIDEGSLTLYYWDTSTGKWVALPTVVDRSANTLTATVDHLTKFAVMGTAGWKVYMPMMARNSAGAW